MRRYDSIIVLAYGVGPNGDVLEKLNPCFLSRWT